ncbi:hypothetical protein [Streptomyces albipurpureus]|uniref:MFS transporter n=1 Tax=Streptomyces albipurpureus TaxID=2897419 RepID=A0ABT0UXB8_9ACTN|nr:hypothetical protein [Streptomyces sp. CWNU-1]MCM2393047.1 hypothetical protein [Streptomyces sp. CWNU-1]
MPDRYGRIHHPGFTTYAGAHGAEGAIYAGSAVLGIGVGSAFAALANLVVSVVDRSRTGEVTGINTIMRTIGGSLGAQIAASVVASRTIPGTQIPAESGYTTAFVMSAIAVGVATLVALTVPGRLWQRATAPAPSPPPGVASPAQEFP